MVSWEAGDGVRGEGGSENVKQAEVEEKKPGSSDLKGVLRPKAQRSHYKTVYRGNEKWGVVYVNFMAT